MQSSLIELVKEEETPLYIYDLDLLKRTLEHYITLLDRYNYEAHYAIKANANRTLLKIIKEYGLGADCVSGNEISLALSVGFDPKKILFAGVGKSDKEIVTGLEADILAFNCESVEELLVIDEIASSLGRRCSVSLRINPNIDANTHSFITTGKLENKFGIAEWRFDDAIEIMKSANSLDFKGLHFHIGSQICDLDVFKRLSLRVNQIVSYFETEGMVVESINMGGGLGVDYLDPNLNEIANFEGYFETIDRYLIRRADQSVHFEPGRALVAQCGSLISKILYVKRGEEIDFVIIDAGMSDLIRPALYGASHKIENISSLSKEKVLYNVVGPICESSDLFGEKVSLSKSKRGDFIAIRSAGAYGEVMAMKYNQRDLVSHRYLE